MRYDDWRPRLTAYLAGVSRTPFEYGKHDCALFAAGAVEAMTGEDVARGFRGYRTLKAGVKKARAKGFRDHVEIFAKRFDEVPVAMAQVGDVAIVPGDDGLAVGIVQGEQIYVAAPRGIGLVPLLTAKQAFRV